MHGMSSREGPARGRYWHAVSDWFRSHRHFSLIVLLPTLLAAVYFYGVASNQYAAEAHFVVRTADTPQPKGSGFGVALASMGVTSSDSDARIIQDYLVSGDAVDKLDQRVGLVARYRRAGVDPVSRLWFANPTPETLLKYYQSKTTILTHSESGITSIQVRGFTPADALVITNELLLLAEDRVNVMNRRNYQSAVAAAQSQVQDAERNVADAQRQITAFRREQRDFDPAKTGTARVSLVGELQAQLAAARASEQSMAAALAPNAPQLVAQRTQVAALERQVAGEQGRIASGPGNVATGLGEYEGLQMRQEFASKQYETAAASLQSARSAAARQQLFVVRTVDPTLPVKSLYPKRTQTVITILGALLLAYGIGWLIAAGVKEHSI